MIGDGCDSISKDIYDSHPAKPQITRDLVYRIDDRYIVGAGDIYGLYPVAMFDTDEPYFKVIRYGDDVIPFSIQYSGFSDRISIDTDCYELAYGIHSEENLRKLVRIHSDSYAGFAAFEEVREMCLNRNNSLFVELDDDDIY